MNRGTDVAVSNALQCNGMCNAKVGTCEGFGGPVAGCLIAIADKCNIRSSKHTVEQTINVLNLNCFMLRAVCLLAIINTYRD